MAKVFGFDEAGFRRVVAATQQVLRTPTKGSQRTARQPVLSAASGGAQIIRFTVTSVDCDYDEMTGTVVDVICGGGDVAVGDVVELADPQFELSGNPLLVEGRTGFAVKMAGGGCIYNVMTTENLGTNCG